MDRNATSQVSQNAARLAYDRLSAMVDSLSYPRGPHPPVQDTPVPPRLQYPVGFLLLERYCR
jgi:hypothetical protein